MAQRSKKVGVSLYLERVTLQDKKSMFRATQPTEYLLRVCVDKEGGGTVIVREYVFLKKAEQEAAYQALRSTFRM